MLDEIVAKKRTQLCGINQVAEIARLKSLVDHRPAVRSLTQALKADGAISIIAEIKRRSPSKGLLRPELDPADLAKTYQNSGAAAISVLTETEFFDGSLDDLEMVSRAVTIPVLRKDFIISEYQVWESRAHGADAVLLIAACLDDETLDRLTKTADEARLEALIEINTREDLNRVLALNPALIGINNRNLRTFEVDLSTVRRLAPEIPDGIVVVSASGISTRDQMLSLENSNIDAVLVGEALMKADNPGLKIRQLLGEDS